ncbi:TPA: hypothetical protein HA242_03460 [Candidatus Woesearchaeota archaeon]|nr:hypothetical protein [Candidatus Woesearchaeota archaeon]HIG93128.1 hypothetical protein [Candidatus Woesearchaeota archaeon]HIH12752.1 hypothetical protein [Candidatus Woesearchaeota archaeon]
MVNKLLHPQEIETFYVIPTLRRYLALYLKEQGMKQKDIASLLMINTATISQYQSNKRGHQIDFDKNMLAEIKKSAVRIKDRMNYLREIQHLLRLIRSTKTLCEIHKKFSDVPKGCEPAETGCHPHEPALVQCT